MGLKNVKNPLKASCVSRSIFSDGSVCTIYEFNLLYYANVFVSEVIAPENCDGSFATRTSGSFATTVGTQYLALFVNILLSRAFHKCPKNRCPQLFCSRKNKPS